jgi:hypothetical protein
MPLFDAKIVSSKTPNEIGGPVEKVVKGGEGVVFA